MDRRFKNNVIYLVINLPFLLSIIAIFVIRFGNFNFGDGNNVPLTTNEGFILSLAVLLIIFAIFYILGFVNIMNIDFNNYFKKTKKIHYLCWASVFGYFYLVAVEWKNPEPLLNKNRSSNIIEKWKKRTSINSILLLIVFIILIIEIVAIIVNNTPFGLFALILSLVFWGLIIYLFISYINQIYETINLSDEYKKIKLYSKIPFLNNLIWINKLSINK